MMWLLLQVNIPLMRQVELMDGIAITDSNGELACHSKVAAREGIGKVVFLCKPLSVY